MSVGTYVVAVCSISVVSSQFFWTSLKTEQVFDIRQFWNTSLLIWTVNATVNTSTPTKHIPFKCKVDEKTGLTLEYVTFTRNYTLNSGKQTEYWNGTFVGMRPYPSLVLLTPQGQGQALLTEYLAYADQRYTCGIMFTAFFLPRVLGAHQPDKNKWPTLLAPGNINKLHPKGIGYSLCEERRKGDRRKGPVITSACQDAFLMLCGDKNIFPIYDPSCLSPYGCSTPSACI
ncbi:uncharacterized protein LOC144141759 isoform X2 [Haemaphysalis longicornis]